MSRIPTILLVEDQQLFRLGLRISLEKLQRVDIAGEAEDGEMAVSEALRLKPDVILMDVGLPVLDGIEATWRIKQSLPRTRVIMFTSRHEPEDVTAALGAGADGYCIKDTRIEDIVRAIEVVMNGGVWIDPAIASIVVSEQVSNKTGKGKLTSLEKKVLSFLREGVDYNEIAAQIRTDGDSVTRIMRNIIFKFVEASEQATQAIARTNLHVSQHTLSVDWFADANVALANKTVFAEKYLLEQLLGSGGAGAVYKAKHLYMDRTVALKLLQPYANEDLQMLRSFQQEAKLISSIEHKNVVAVYDFGVTREQQPFLVMEFIDGTDLEQILEIETKLKLHRFIRIFAELTSALETAHSRNVIHCDIKPSNILVVHAGRQDETVKLFDFGLAKTLPRHSTTQTQVTESYFVGGTPPYMSPEQCSGGQLDARSDVYSLGCVMYEALSGEQPFLGDNPALTFAKHFQYYPPELSERCHQAIPQELNKCIMKMLQKDPAARQQSICEVKQILEHLACSLDETHLQNK